MTDFEKRCEDCACLIQKGKVWCCDECFGQPCNEIDDCPEGLTVEQVAQAQSVKAPKVVAQSDKERKPVKRERKPNEDKRHLVSVVRVLLEGLGCDVEVTNAERELVFHFNGVKYKITLSAPRS